MLFFATLYLSMIKTLLDYQTELKDVNLQDYHHSNRSSHHQRDM